MTGLGIYGGSGSSSSDNSDDENSQEKKDSDLELKVQYILNIFFCLQIIILNEI